MKENAMLATVSEKGGARLVLEELSLLKKALGDKLEIHMAGHSAGSIFNAPFINLLTAKDKIKSGPLKGQQGYNLTIESCTLWAPACTIELFKEMYLPAIKENSISRFALLIIS